MEGPSGPGLVAFWAVVGAAAALLALLLVSVRALVAERRQAAAAARSVATGAAGSAAGAAEVTGERLAEEQQRTLALLAENSDDLIVVAGLDLRLQYLNAAGRRLVGVDQDVVGAVLGGCYGEDTAAVVDDQVLPAVTKGGAWSGLLRLRHRGTGEDIEAYASVFGIPDPETGRTTAFAAVLRDVRADRRAEEERGHVENRPQRAQRLESLGQLAGGVAHDFNNLLMVIISYAQLALERLPEHPDDPGDTATRQEMSEIHAAAQRAAVLTRQLLAFSSREVVTPRVLDLNEVLADVERLLRRTIGEDIELRTEYATDLWHTEADPHQMEQVALNLAVNARDAMPGGGTLTIGTANVPVTATGRAGATGPADLVDADVAPGDYVALTVSDSGAGMTPDVAAMAFDPFFSTKPRGQGTGLGLATVDGIVERAGGRITLTSEPGTGTVVTVLLPATNRLAAGVTPPQRDPRGGHGETVLVVEDEEAVRELAVRLLKRHGYRVLEARDAARALDLLEQHDEVDVLLTDVIMPRVSGPEMAQHVREVYKNVRVILMSGYSHSVLGRYVAPDTFLLEKPFSQTTLLEAVWAALDEPAAAQPERP